MPTQVLEFQGNTNAEDCSYFASLAERAEELSRAPKAEYVPVRSPQGGFVAEVRQIEAK